MKDAVVFLHNKDEKGFIDKIPCLIEILNLNVV